jgi:hypothetical protein
MQYTYSMSIHLHEKWMQLHKKRRLRVFLIDDDVTMKIWSPWTWATTMQTVIRIFLFNSRSMLTRFSIIIEIYESWVDIITDIVVPIVLACESHPQKIIFWCASHPFGNKWNIEKTWWIFSLDFIYFCYETSCRARPLCSFTIIMIVCYNKKKTERERKVLDIFGNIEYYLDENELKCFCWMPCCWVHFINDWMCC